MSELQKVNRYLQDSRRGRLVIREAAAHLLAYRDYRTQWRGYLPDVIKATYGDDRDIMSHLVTRAASSPTTMTTAAAFVETDGVPGFISILAPQCAGAALLERGTQFHFDGKGAIFVSGFSPAAAAGSPFVGEGTPIGVRQKVTSGVLLSPDAFKTISVFTREITEHSIPNIETAVRAEVTWDAAIAMDTAVFDTNPADGVTRPAGLRNGIAGLTPSAATVKSEALQADVEQLVTAVSSVSSNSAIVFICSPAQALALAMLPNVPYEILSSSQLAVKTVIAVAANCIVSACDPMPRFEIADAATLHMDTSPLPISTTPGTFAAPVRSLWQTDSVALRMIWEISWGLRNSSGLAWLSPTLW
jgi:hypothetical protein